MKNYIFILLLSLSGLTAQGQNSFAPLGAEWYYLDNSFYNIAMGPNPPLHIWVDRMVVEKDTVYDGVNCKKHVVTRTIKYFNNPIAQLHSTVNHYSYNSGDTVLFFNSYTQSFKPLYVFNVNAGDTVCVSTFAEPNLDYPDSNFCYVVDSVKMVDFDGQFLKTYYTSAIINEDYRASFNFGVGFFFPEWRHPGMYTERLGAGLNNVGLFPASSIKRVDGWPEKGMPSGAIKCYTDSMISYKPSTLPCDSFVGITGIIDRYANTLDIKLYPNPAKGKVTFTSNTIFNEATQITIFDISGRQVWATLLPSNNKMWTIDLPNLNKGMYLLKAKNSKGLLQQKLLLE